jgi:hypothetical protein
VKHQSIAYVVVAVLSIGAGVAIAGLPNNAPGEATITAPTTAAETETTLAPVSTVASTTTDVQATTRPVTETTEPPQTTTASVSTEIQDPVAEVLADRSEIVVVVANGAGIAGAAARNVVRLTDLGHLDITSSDGTEIVEFTTIYFADGFEDAALRLAEDLELLPFFVAPLEVAPTVSGLPDDVELLAYIGTDRA